MANVESMLNQNQIAAARYEPERDDMSLPWDLYRPWAPPGIDPERVDLSCLIREPYGVCGPYEGLF